MSLVPHVTEWFVLVVSAVSNSQLAAIASIKSFADAAVPEITSNAIFTSPLLCYFALG